MVTFYRNILVLLTSIVAAGCAKVTVTPVDPVTGAALTNQAEGLRYYPPKPYLLVLEVPPDSQIQNNADAGGAQSRTGARASKKNQNNSDDVKKQISIPSGNSSNGDTSSLTGNTSFSMFTKQHGVKLIYLPDLSHPMAMSENPGLFGTADMKPVLQDGWMLTSIDATGDSKVSDTISAVASLVSSIYGGRSGGTGSGKAAKSNAAANGAATHNSVPNPPVLPPGLYEFTFTNSHFSSVNAVAYFCESGVSTTPCQ